MSRKKKESPLPLFSRRASIPPEPQADSNPSEVVVHDPEGEPVQDDESTRLEVPGPFSLTRETRKKRADVGSAALVPPPFEPEKLPDMELLPQLASAIQGLDGDRVSESEIRKKFSRLYFALWSEFGSFSRAAMTLLKSAVGRSWDEEALRGGLRDRYDLGEVVSLSRLVTEDPQFAAAVLRHFGGLDEGLLACGINPRVAAEDRRWTEEQLFETVLQRMAGTEAPLAEVISAMDDELFQAAARWRFGSMESLIAAVSSWLARRPSILVPFGRTQLGRILQQEIPQTHRSGKGSFVAGVFKVSGLCPVGANAQPMMVTSLGRLLPLRDEDVAFLSLRGDEVTEGKLQGLKRGEKLVSVLDFARKTGWIAVATRQGRVKIIPRDEFKRIGAEGTVVIRLAQTDRVAAVAHLSGESRQWTVLTLNGRAVGFDLKGLRPSGRRSMGVYRIHWTEGSKDEPIAICEMGEARDVVLLGRNAQLLRLAFSEIPIRKGGSLGRRVWRTPVVGAASCAVGDRLCLASRRGRVLCFGEAEVPGRQALRQGVRGIRLDGDDTPEAICRLPGES